MKTTRQQEILSIIANQEIETQEQLLESLKAKGIHTTQATISRDIKQLHLVKELTSSGVYKYAASRHHHALNFAGRLRTIFREGATIDSAQNIVVVKTMPGMANAVASALDGMNIPALVGSLAGDDTVILIMRTNEDAEEFKAEMRQMLS